MEQDRRRPLPVPLTRLVGRADAIAELLGHLRAARLVTVVGDGGAGKTRLALAVAAEAERLGRSVCFVDLSAVASGPPWTLPMLVTEAPTALPSGHLHASAAESAAGPLVVLDNCEHLHDHCARVVAHLLVSDPTARVLATTRQSLGVPGEVVWRIPPLSLPPDGPAPVEALVASGAVQLFCDRARQAAPSFRPGTEDLGAIVDICRRLEGNALCIELAAARISTLPPVEIAARLENPFAVLSAGATTAPERHRSLRATLDWSYGGLSQAERGLLECLAGLPGTVGLEAVEEAWCRGPGHEAEHVLGLLASLVDKSLVVRSAAAGSACFGLPAFVRAYAAQRTEEAPGRVVQGGLTAPTGTQAVSPCSPALGDSGEALASTGPVALTPAERRVAVLAAEGLSNKAIARQLVVSRRTVETHLQRVYGKLGIRSRTDLAYLPKLSDER